MAECIEREAAVDALNKALFFYEDETEARFKNDPDLDISEWFFHRIFVQNMNEKDRQTVLDIPAADVIEVVRCGECEYWGTTWNPKAAKNGEHYCPATDLFTTPDWFCADGERRDGNG